MVLKEMMAELRENLMSASEFHHANAASVDEPFPEELSGMLFNLCQLCKDVMLELPEDAGAEDDTRLCDLISFFENYDSLLADVRERDDLSAENIREIEMYRSHTRDRIQKTQRCIEKRKQNRDFVHAQVNRPAASFLHPRKTG